MHEPGSKLSVILRETPAFWDGAAMGTSFFLFYLLSIGNLTGATHQSFSVQVVPDWLNQMFKPIAPWMWEPIARLQGFGVSLLLAPLNLLVGIVLASLVFLNMAVAAFSYRLSRVCQIQPGFKGVLGFLPGLLSGFACCVPTFLIALGPALASFTVFFIELRPFLIPASVLLMTAGLKWSLDRIPETTPGRLEERPVPTKPSHTK